jgi:uncharacterized sporulation protein YeaH/YhbH (DUF444 family)
MDSEKLKIYEELKQKGLTPEEESRLLAELQDEGRHEVPGDGRSGPDRRQKSVPEVIYAYHDLLHLQYFSAIQPTYNVTLRSLDELLARDNQRAKDGFPRKINVGRLIKPGRGGKEKVVVVPTTVEEKFIHDMSPLEQQDEETSGGTGEGEEGEVIGEQPIRQEGGSGTGPGEGEGGDHEMESNAYDLGKILTEQFELPNLKDKGKKRSLTRYTYDLTDRHRGFGQILDKKATLRRVLETNITLGNVPDLANIDPTKFLIAPDDKVFRILSREKDYESQAMVFFLRDYSGSMAGKTTELIVTQHVLIYSWLLYQYARQVETRFILHDTEAKEVKDFYTYYNSAVAGGTKVASAFHLVNELVEKENLVQDYNIYVFHGTDGDDWDKEGIKTIPEIKKMLKYANRIGISIAEHSTGAKNGTEVERYLKKSGLLKEQAKLIRLDVFKETDAGEARLMEGIKKLIGNGA